MKRALIIAGLVLFVLGILGLVHPQFTYHKTEEVAHIGPVRATVNEEKTATVPTAAAIILLIAGLGATVVGVSRGS
ncbi:MAG TPA: hypothetical protein VIW23_13185 [Candidatus Acidoferrum sp.]|jgi:uncharacterized membrane protein